VCPDERGLVVLDADAPRLVEAGDVGVVLAPVRVGDALGREGGRAAVRVVGDVVLYPLADTGPSKYKDSMR
jgi:hypothetical protein